MQRKDINIGSIAYNKETADVADSGHLVRLLDAIEAFNRLTDIDEIFEEIGKASQSLMNTQVSSLIMLNEQNDAFCVAYSTAPIKDNIKNKRIPRHKGFCGWVAEHKLPLIANDIEPDDAVCGEEISDHINPKNLICAPLLDKDNNVLGVLEAINRFDPPLSEKDLPIFQMLANHAAGVIERVQAARTQGDRLKEQDMYLTEIHHRVKNDLALISGIVELESFDVENENARSVLKNIQSRIKSMAFVYELLSGDGSHSRAKMNDYFEKLVNGISEALGERNKDIDIQIHTEPIIIDPYKALSCGLILNELLLNTFKHAFNNRKEGAIEIELYKNEQGIWVDYKDDGPGFPKDFDIKAQDSIGFRMIRALVSQLDGTLDIRQDLGAHFVVNFQAECMGQYSSNNVGSKTVHCK